MKRFLLLISLFITTVIAAQTNTWNGSVSNAWGNAGNWSLGIIPTVTHDVVIPTGSIVTLNSPGNVLSINVQGNAQLTIAQNLNIRADSYFGPNSTITWNSGSLSTNVANVTLTNEGTVNLLTLANKVITGQLAVSNKGTFNLKSGGDLLISDGSLNNETLGTIDFQTDAGNISYSGGGAHIFNNLGLIKRSGATGSAQIIAPLNNSGTITVESGTLHLNSFNTILNAGVYNVSAGATMHWNNTVHQNSTMTGVVDGTISWTGNVRVAVEARWVFTGSGSIIWTAGSLDGGGSLTNEFLVELDSSANKVITGVTTMNNAANMNIISAGDLMVSDGAFNNLSSGTFELQAADGNLSYTGGGLHVFTNAGLLKRSGSSGLAYIYNEFTNTGIMQVETGKLSLSSGFAVLDGGTYNVLTDATLEFNGMVEVISNLEGTISGKIDWRGSVSVSSSATFDFAGSGIIDWRSGSLTGGGALTNDFSIALSSLATKTITGFATLNNTGLIYFQDAGDLDLMGGSLNNLSSGVIDLRTDGAAISYTGGSPNLFTNAGEIRKSTSSGNASIIVNLTNTGTISVQSGTLTLNTFNTTLNGGVYNILPATSLVWSGTVNLNSTLTGTVEGSINWIGQVSVATSAMLDFDGTGVVNWSSGQLNGGGVLTNSSLIALNSMATKSIIGYTTLDNAAVINFTDGGDLSIQDGIFNNLAAGIIDMQADGGNITYAGGGTKKLNNFGLIKKTTSGGEAQIICFLTNTGTISSEQGTLRLVYPNIELDGGIYNTFTGATMIWDWTVLLSGTLTGTNNGALIWINTVQIPGNATLEIAGNPISWNSGSLDGPGIFINNSEISLLTASNKTLNNNLNLYNNGRIAIESSGALFVNSALLTNAITGEIDMQTDNSGLTYSGGAYRQIINYGRIVKSQGTGTSYIYPPMTNYGTLEVVSGIFDFPGGTLRTSEASGIMTGTGTFNLPPSGVHWNNIGTIAPGGNPGTLTITSNYAANPGATVLVDINGTSALEHDQLLINKPVSFASIKVNLGYQAGITDEFPIVIAPLPFPNCNLSVEPTIYEDLLYTFGTYCTADLDNDITLRIIAIRAVDPIAEEQTFCSGATLTDLQADGQNIKWYLTALDGFPLAPDHVLFSATYYVTQTVSGYESARIPVGVTIYDTPAPIANAQNFVGSATVADLVAAGTNLQWYDVAVGGSALSASTALTEGTYYVTQTLDGCESDRVAVTVTISQTFPFYVDADGDTFGAGELVNVTADNAETPPTGYSLNNTDCDDENELVWQSVNLYIDQDGDGYDNGMEEVCFGATIPTGYSDSTNGSDCDDTDVNAFEGYPFFVDGDGDGFGSGASVLLCTADPNTAPAGYSLTGTDCDDEDADVWKLDTLYIDNDGDGYDDGIEEICHGATAPEGYSMTSNGVDCNDNNSNIWMTSELYVDSDGDGYDDGSEEVCHGTTAPDGYSMTTNGADCDDEDANTHQSAMLYIDNDNDGYDSGSEMVCYGASIPEGYAMTSMGADCDDSNAAINPSAAEIPNNGIDENCNGMQDDATDVLVTQIKSSHCGSTLTDVFAPISANAVAEATAYKFIVTNTSTSVSQSVIRNVAWFSFTNLASFAYGTTYSIAVELEVDGVWTGVTGPSCTVATPALEGNYAAGIKQCGVTITDFYSPLIAHSYPGVTGYRFRVSNLSNPLATNAVQVLTRAVNWFSFTNLSGFDYGAAYSVEVSLLIQGEYSAYGDACTVFTAALAGIYQPGIKQCGVTYSDYYAPIIARSYPGVSGYMFRVTNLTTESVQVITRNVNWISFNHVADLQNGIAYEIEVSLLINGSYSAYGPPCTVFTAAAAIASSDPSTISYFKVIASPNPFTDSFGINITSDVGSPVTLQVYDMMGKLLESKTVQLNVESDGLGTNYPSGVYNVVVIQDDVTETLRVIKR